MKTNNHKLLEKILSSDEKITSLDDTWGVENDQTAWWCAIESGHLEIALKLYKYLTDSKLQAKLKFGEATQKRLSTKETGFLDLSIS